MKVKWDNFAPWFITIASTVALAAIGFFLIRNINWYKDSVFDDAIKDVNTPEFRFYAYHLFLSMVKRSIGLFSGFAIMFLGMGVAFFTLKESTTVDGQVKGASIKLVTASPGIIALLIGAFLIASTINSKDNFPAYNSVEPIEQPLNVRERPEVPH